MLTLESARRSLLTDANSVYGICEVLRLTYDLVHTIQDKELRDKITDKLADAMLMAKKMDARLKYYKTTYPQDTTGHGTKNLIRLSGSSALRRMRLERKYD